MPRNPQCDKCPLGERAKTTCVWGESVGAGRPSVMVVGEAPGHEEDANGRPFIGPSGRLLREELRLAGVESYYITNVVKCLSAGPPKPASVKACLPYLEEEIAAVRPTCILLLGNTPLRAIVGPGSVTEYAGREVWSDKYQCWIVPLPHPAYVLRSMGTLPSWRLSLARFARLASGYPLVRPPVDVRVVRAESDLRDLQRIVCGVRPLAYDFEATPYPWWHRDMRPLTVAFSWNCGQEAFVLPLQHEESPWSADRLRAFFTEVRPYLEDRGPTNGPPPGGGLVAHNAIYDALAWYRIAGYVPYTSCDTMVLWHLLDDNAPKGLKWLGSTLLGWAYWGIDTKASHPLQELALYNGYDAAAAAALREILLMRLADEDPRLGEYARLLAMPVLRALCRLVANGVYVDEETLARSTAEAKSNLEAAAALLPVKTPSSPQQIARWLYQETGLPVSKLTPKGQPSTAEGVIHALARVYPQARAVLDYRKWAKYLSVYLGPIAKDLSCVAPGLPRRYYPEYRSVGARTGRISGFFHTTPRDALVRSVFSAPPGRVLVSVDMSQIEARLAAWAAAGYPTEWDSSLATRGRMLWAFHKGVDVYVLMAAYALGKRPEDITKQERQAMGKVPTLALIYRISAEKLREYAWNEYQLDWDQATASKLWNAFYELWPEMKRWHESCEHVILARGWTRSPLGRVRRLPEALSDDPKERQKAINAGVNAPIQSLAWDITSAALIVLEGLLAERDAGKVVGTVHDSVIMEVELARLDEKLLRAIDEATRRSHEALVPLGLRLPPGLIKCEISLGPWGQGVPPEKFSLTRPGESATMGGDRERESRAQR